MNSQLDHDSGVLAQALAVLARMCGRFPRLVLGAVALSCALAVAYTAFRLTYQTHRNDLISKNKDYYQRWSKYIEEFGDDEDLVAVVEGGDRATMISVLDEIACRVAAEGSA